MYFFQPFDSERHHEHLRVRRDRLPVRFVFRVDIFHQVRPRDGFVSNAVAQKTRVSFAQNNERVRPREFALRELFGVDFPR